MHGDQFKKKSTLLLMKKIASRGLRPVAVLVVAFLLTTACDLRHGFLESQFRLADESRLPKWFEASKHHTRSNLNVVITFYGHPILGSRVGIVLYDVSRGERRELEEKVGTRQWKSHLSSVRNNAGTTDIPGNYVTITVDGVEEVFEHRTDGDVLHIVDR